MYESFFSFQQRPFAAAPRIDRYFPGAAIDAARQSLARTIERAEGAGLIIGPSGTGKTLACHLLAEQFHDRFAVALLSNGHLDTRRELLQAILFELGLPYRRMEEGELRLSLIDYISNGAQARDGLLLLVDEAHTLPARLLEEIRLIANVVRHGQSRVRMLLAGDPALEETLADPQLEALTQRIATRCYLNGLDHQQTQQYVLAQLAAVGATRHVFTPDALDAVYRATDGIPRLINQVCDHALMLAFAGGRNQISRAGVEEAWSDLQQLPMPWARTQRLPEDTGRDGVIEFGDLDDEAQPLRRETAWGSGPVAAESEPSTAAEASFLMHQIDRHLSELDRDFMTDTFHDERRTATSAASDPFGEPFEHEEVLLDRYSSLEPGALAGHLPVASDEGRELAALLETVVQSSISQLAVNSATSAARAPRIVVSSAAERLWSQATTEDVQEPPCLSRLAAVENIEAHDDPTEYPTDDGEWWGPPALPLVRGIRGVPDADDDLMIVEDDPRAETGAHPRPAARQVRRQEFRQLFSSLRRGG